MSTTALGRPRAHLRETDSTNERARALALAGAPHGTLVTTAAQTAGRGRQGRSWSAPPGGALLCSLVLRDPPALLPLIAAVAVCDAVGEQALVKWPNDIVLVRSPAGEGSEEDDARRPGAPRPGAPAMPHGLGAPTVPRLAKLAGILIEGRPQEEWAVLGIGVNVAIRVEDLPPDVRPRAASLERPPSAIEPLLRDVLAALERRLAEPAAAVLDAWRARDALRGHTVAWTGGRGVAEGIDGAGRLVVALPAGGHTALDAGEVHLSVGVTA